MRLSYIAPPTINRKSTTTQLASSGEAAMWAMFGAEREETGAGRAISENLGRRSACVSLWRTSELLRRLRSSEDALNATHLEQLDNARLRDELMGVKDRLSHLRSPLDSVNTRISGLAPNRRLSPNAAHCVFDS